MKLKNYYISFVLLLTGFVGFAQTPNNLLEDPSNTIKMDFEKITSKKNPSAKLSEESIQTANRQPFGPIEPCLIDPATGECVEITPPCDGLVDPITGECIDIIDPPCDGIVDPITGDCLDPIDLCADCTGLCNQLTGECFDIINIAVI